MARCVVVVVGPTRLRLHHYSVVTNLSSNSCEGYNFPLFYFNKEEVLSMTVPTPGADFKILGKYFFSSFQLSRIVQFCAFTNFNHFLSVQKGFVSIETGASVKSDDLYHSEWINLAVAAVIVIWRIFIFVVLKMFALTGHVGGIFASEKWSENYFRLVDDDDPHVAVSKGQHTNDARFTRLGSAFIRLISVTRLGEFYKFLATNCLTKVPQIFLWLFGLFLIMSLLCKKCVATFWSIFEGN